MTSRSKKTDMSDGEYVTRRYTFKLAPTPRQAAALDEQRRLHAALWNALLQQREEAWRRQRRSLTAFDQGKELTLLRRECPEYNALSRGSMEQTVKRLDLAFAAFFRRAKAGAGAASGYPRFRRTDRYEGFGFREAGHGGWTMAFKQNGRRGTCTFQGIPGRVRFSGEFPRPVTEIRNCDLMLRDGRWWLSVVVRLAPKMAAGTSTATVRFDLLTSFASVNLADGPPGSGPFGSAEGPNIPQRSEGLEVICPAIPTNDGMAGGMATRGEVNDGPAIPTDGGMAGVGSRHRTGPAIPADVGMAGVSKPSQDRSCCPAIPTNGGMAGEGVVGELGRACPAIPTNGGMAGEVSGRWPPSTRPAIPTNSGMAGESLPARDRPAVPTDGGMAGGTMISDDCPAVPEGGGMAGVIAATPCWPRRPAVPEDSGVAGVGRVEAGRDRGPTVPEDDGVIGELVGNRLDVNVENLQRRRARCRIGSIKYRRLSARISHLQAKIARQRRESLHEWTTAIVRRSADITVIAPESIRDVTESARGNTRDPGAAVAFKAMLNRNVLSFAPAMALQMLEYKAAEAGAKLQVVADAEPPAAIGGEVVKATKAVRKARRQLKRKEQ